jgi:FkbM family methyltransferase
VIKVESQESLLNQLLEENRFCALGPDRTVEFPFLDVWCKLYIPFAQTDLIQKVILRHRTFFEHYLLLAAKDYVMPGSIVADIGANIGNHAIFFSHVCKASKVHAFEPQSVAFKILERNAEVNNLENIEAHNVAIGAKNGFARLTRFTQTNMGGSEFAEAESGPYIVRTLDSFELERLDFIKLDVEGSQSRVLAGGAETITMHKPLIWAEIRPSDAGDVIFDEFKALGYRVEKALGKTDYLFTSE